MVRSFSANARARAFKAPGTAHIQGKTQRGDTTGRHNEETQRENDAK